MKLCTALFIGVTAVDGATFLQQPNATQAPAHMNVEKLRNQVMQSEVFQKKVTVSCQAAGPSQKDACTAKAQEFLFCQLMRNVKADLTGSQCDAQPVALAETRKQKPVALVDLGEPDVQLASMKTKIMSSADFKEQTEKMAAMFGCSTVNKKEKCMSYVQEVAFCLAFADQMSKFHGMAGVAEEKEYCKHVDEKIPQMALLLQSPLSFVQIGTHLSAPEDDLAKEMTHDLEMNFNKIAPFGKEDTAKELQDHAAKTQDTLVDAVENAEVAEIKRAVFRALTRLRAATIKEFDTIARLETQSIDAYNDAHHYRAENPLAHLHEDEAPVETDKLKSFH